MTTVIDRTPVPCRHKIAQHAHGHYATYKLDHCRCAPCTDANTAYMRNRTRQSVYGRWQPYVPADAARAHVLELRAQGLGLKRIARASGVPHGALSKLIYGDPSRRQKPSLRIRRETERRLLAVTASIETLGARVGVDATGTHRRLQALVAAGWSQSQLAVRLGMNRSNFGTMLQRNKVGSCTVRAVRALYAELADVPPPETTHREKIAASQARNYAKSRGWLAPAWWDDDQLDGTAATQPAVADIDVDEVAVERAMAGERVPLTKEERAEAIRRMVAAGATVTDIARALGLNGTNAQRYVTESLAVSA